MSVQVESAVLDPALGRVQRALSVVATGEPIVLIDDVLGHGEGSLVLAGEAATPQWTNFLVRHTTGFLRVAMKETDCDRLELPLMRRDRTDRRGSALCVTVDATDVGTGISATARATTIAALARRDSAPDEFTRPGHVVPVRARDGGLFVRAGRGEAVVDLMRIGGLRPSGVYSEVVVSERTGEIGRGPQLMTFADDHGLECLSVSEIREYRRSFFPELIRTSDLLVGSSCPGVRLVSYRNAADDATHLAVVAGDPQNAPVVVQHECLDAVLGLSTCDCGTKWHEAVGEVVEAGHGIAVRVRRTSSGCAEAMDGEFHETGSVAEQIVEDLRLYPNNPT